MSSESNAHFLAVVQLVFMSVWFISQSQSAENALKSVTVVAHYVVYLLTARGLQQLCMLAYTALNTGQLSLSKLFEESKYFWITYIAAIAVLVTSRQRILGEDFPLIFAAFLVCQCLQTEQKLQKPAPTINYGTGMACSFFEGYLKHIIPSDGKSHGFVGKIRDWEDSQQVVFPVKRLLLVITKSLYCPPDLVEFNDHNRYDLPQIEPCVDKSHVEVKKDVAGVKNRRYSNTIYKIYWPNGSQPPVYLAAECATPLHTLYGVLNNHELYKELSSVDRRVLVDDFKKQLLNILERSPECRNKCELVEFDDSKDSTEYLPEVLLRKIEKLEPNYREVIANRAAQYEDAPFESQPI